MPTIFAAKKEKNQLCFLSLSKVHERERERERHESSKNETKFHLRYFVSPFVSPFLDPRAFLPSQGTPAPEH